MEAPCVVTGQQIGVGWTPALSVVKALMALAAAQTLGGRAQYWLADEDHDRAEVSNTLALEGGRLRRHRFRFEAPAGTATGWLPWTQAHQQEAEALWGEVPSAQEATLRAHALALGEPLWQRGLEPFSPTEGARRDAIQEELLFWRSLDLEADLRQHADHLEQAGERLVLDPRNQHAWFSLDPKSGQRRPLEAGEACPREHWLSPGAALRPLMQSLLLPVTHAVLGPAERAYWRLCEPLWERVGLRKPELIARPSVYLLPRGTQIQAESLEALRHGQWECFAGEGPALPSQLFQPSDPDPAWGPALIQRFQQTQARTRQQLAKLDHRLQRDLAAQRFGLDPERLRQHLFPFDKPQERVLPGLFWLRSEALIDRLLQALRPPAPPIILLEEP